MKSLDILDDIRLDLERYLDYLENDLQERIKNNESEISINEVSDLKAILVTNMYYGINAIKQDLEVLEILRKHLYIHTSYGDSDYGEYEDKSICINEIHECFCKEHFNKLKQWLEVNENE